MTDPETEDEQSQADHAFVKALFAADPDQTFGEPSPPTTEQPGRGLFAPKGETE